MRRKLGIQALFLAAALLTLAPSAFAGVKVSGVDTGAYPLIKVNAVTSQRTAKPPQLLENGQRVVVRSAQNLGRAKSVALLVDRSQSMKGRPLANAAGAARAFIAAKPTSDRIAVITFATEPVVATRFSTSTIDADIALRSIPVDKVQGTTLYDAIVLSARQLATEPLPARVIIIVTDGNETRSEASLKDAISAAHDAGAAVYVVAIESAKFTPAPLKQLANETGGNYYGAASSEALAGVYRSIAAELSRTWRLEYATAARPGERLALTAHALGSSSAPARLTLPGAEAAKGEAPSRLLPAVFYSPVGTQLIALITGLIVLIGATIATTTVKGARLRKRLAPHVATRQEARKRKQERHRLQMAEGLFRVTENALSKWSLWNRLERLVERSDLSLRTVEVAYMIVGAALLGGIAATLFGLGTLITLAVVGGAGSVPVVFVWFKASRRTKAFENQLPDVLITLAAALKAGHSFKAGLQTIVDEGHEPASKEFHRVLAEARLGRPLNDALADMSTRLGSKNFDFVITSVTIQQQVGGSLAQLIDMVADTVRQRQQFIRKIKGLTAMGRAGAYVLIGLPFFIAAIITIINPTYMDPLYNTDTGHKLIYTGLAMMAFGTLVLKKIVSFKG
jgi:tight adherence protein B